MNTATNYMRNRDNHGALVLFLRTNTADELHALLDAQADPAPSHWAVYASVQGMDPRFRIIGEDSDFYMLRQLAMRGPVASRPLWQKTLQSWLKSDGTKDRVSVRDSYNLHLLAVA